MQKILRSIAIIAICAVILYIGNIWQKNHAEKQREIDLTKTTIITQLVSLNNLETAKMSMQKVVEGKKGFEDLLPGKNWDNVIQNFLFEDSITMTAFAEITAGFDLNQLTTGSIAIAEDKSISLTLPAPKIIHASLTNETKPFVRKRGILSAGDLELETDIRNKTLETMTQEAIDNGLLQQAQTNAKDAFTQLFKNMGYTLTEITIDTGNIQL